MHCTCQLTAGNLSTLQKDKTVRVSKTKRKISECGYFITSARNSFHSGVLEGEKNTFIVSVAWFLGLDLLERKPDIIK